MAKSKKIQSVRSNQRTYLAKDFESLRSELVQYGNIYFKDQISDFSENGLAGMFVEMAAYVGDVLSFYLDHQFNELDIQTAVESKNIERLVRAAGVKIKGASPSTAVVDFYLEIPAEYKNNQYIPKVIALPTVKAGTIVTSNSGITFELQEDLIFSTLDSSGIPTAEYKQMKTKKNSDGTITPTTFSILMTGDCRSGIQRTETFSIPDTFEPFRTLTLGSANVSEIISISDSSGNQYYEVESLTQDVVYKRVLNVSSDSNLSPENLELIPAPYRFLAISSRRTSKTTIRFGGGSALSSDDDILPDPSEVSIKLYGDKKTFSRFTLDPNALLKTRTLGIAPRNTTITILYRAGGGLSHNVAANSINTVSTLLTKFPASTTPSVIASVRASTECRNPSAASGGESPQTLNELRATALAFKNSQGRIVTKADLIARIYAMPPNFGRVFRVGVNDNPNNPLSATVSIISRDLKGNLVISPDALKKSLQLYLNEYRLISDSMDIVDAMVLNVGISYGVVIDSVSNKNLTIQNINKELKEYMKIENFQIDQPIITSDLISLIINAKGVVSIVDFRVDNLSGMVNGKVYAANSFSVVANTDRGIVRPPQGAIFEVKFPDDDIIGYTR